MIAAVVLVALVALALALVTRGGNYGSAAAAAATSGVPGDETVAPMPPKRRPPPAHGARRRAAAEPAEVPIDAPAAVGNGIVAAIASVEPIDGTAVGPGNVAGPALRFTVRIDNGTGEAVSLDGVAVNLYYGADRTPASPLDDPSRVLLRHELLPAYVR